MSAEIARALKALRDFPPPGVALTPPCATCTPCRQCTHDIHDRCRRTVICPTDSTARACACCGETSERKQR